MSSNSNNGSSSNRKRYRGKNKNNKGGNYHKQSQANELRSNYRNVTFDERPSSGRPGSPHRYFENSFDVVFDDDVVAEEEKSDGLPLQGRVKEAEGGEEVVVVGEEVEKSSKPANSEDPGIGADDDADASSDADEHPAKTQSGGKQVVHRHLNGLCIVTAGDVLEHIILKQQQTTTEAGEEEGGNNNNNNKEDEEEDNAAAAAAAAAPIEISSIEYLVRVGKDSQSARGKLRTKNKRQKHPTNNRGGGGGGDTGSQKKAAVEDHDGSVSPRDPLCEVTLSNGVVVRLLCCVSGTIIELNHRLDNSALESNEGGINDNNGSGTSGKVSEDEGEAKSMEDEVTGNDKNAEAAEGGVITLVGNRDPSLILKEPLLDGHLAVIMPTWGAFPPKKAKVVGGGGK